MAVVQKVSVHLSQRTMGFAGMMWNRFTPTRWADTVSDAIAGFASSRPVTLTVHNDHLSVKVGENDLPIFRSHAYAASLFKAGVMEIQFETGISSAEVKAKLNTLSDNEIQRGIKALGLNIVYTPDVQLIAKDIFKRGIVFIDGHPDPQITFVYGYGSSGQGGSIESFDNEKPDWTDARCGVNAQELESLEQLFKSWSSAERSKYGPLIAQELRKLGQEVNELYQFSAEGIKGTNSMIEEIISRLGL